MEFKTLAYHAIRDGSVDDIFNVMRSAIDIAASKYPDEYSIRRMNLVKFILSKSVDGAADVVGEETTKTTQVRKIIKIKPKKKKNQEEGGPKLSETAQQAMNAKELEAAVVPTTKLDQERSTEAVIEKPNASDTLCEVKKVLEALPNGEISSFEALKRKYEHSIQLQAKHARRKVRVNLGCGRVPRIST